MLPKVQRSLITDRDKSLIDWPRTPLSYTTNISRQIDGEFHLLLQDLREMDQELFFKYFRMNSQRFD